MKTLPTPLLTRTFQQAFDTIARFFPGYPAPAIASLIVKRAGNPILVWDEANGQVVDLATLLPTQDITINSAGVPQNYAGIVDIGSNFVVNPGSDSVINGASKVTGTISSIMGGSINDTGQFVSASTSSVIGQNGLPSGVSGSDSSLTEGADITCNGTITGGNGFSVNPSFAINGGNASVTVFDRNTLPNFALTAGADDSGFGPTGNGGSASLILISARSTSALNVSFGSNGGQSSALHLIIEGTSLSDFTPTFSGIAPTGASTLSLDFSDCILNNTSMQAVCTQAANISIVSGQATLNIGGLCDVADGTTLALITTLQGLGWNVINN